MSQTRIINDGSVMPPTAINEEHVPVVILADASQSMKDSIDALSAAINSFRDMVCADAVACNRVDVAVVSFDDDVTVIQSWRPITRMEPVHLVAGGQTALNTALVTGTTMLRDRSHEYESLGIQTRMPQLLLVTDGHAEGDTTSADDAAKCVLERSDSNKMRLWALVTRNYDRSLIARITKGKRVFEFDSGMDDRAFREFFLFQSFRVISVSSSSPGEKITVPDSASNVGDKSRGSSLSVPDLDEWLNS